MLTTEEFFHNLHINNMHSAVATSFDQLMVLYNLIGTTSDIEFAQDKQGNTVFDLLCETEESAGNIYNTLNDMKYMVFGRQYIINMNISGCSIHTVITKAISN